LIFIFSFFVNKTQRSRLVIEMREEKERRENMEAFNMINHAQEQKNLHQNFKKKYAVRNHRLIRSETDVTRREARVEKKILKVREEEDRQKQYLNEVEQNM
jgi:hypothetical protein